MKNIWLFQANPDDYDLAIEIQPRRVDDWELNRYRAETSGGDTVILWQSEGKINKKKPGIYGFGKLVDRVGLDRINIEYTELLEMPLLKQDLKNDPVLAELLVIRQAFAANPFAVTAGQWEALRQLIPDAMI